MKPTDWEKWLAGVRRRLRAAREGLGLSFRAAEERTGVAFVSIRRIETGQVTPTLKLLHQLASGYGMTVDEILCDSPKKQPG